MTKTQEYYPEEFEESPEERYHRKKQEEEHQYYLELMEQTDQIELMELDLTDSTEEELFNRILRDEREESYDPEFKNKLKKEIENENRNSKKRNQ